MEIDIYVYVIIINMMTYSITVIKYNNPLI